MIHRPADLSSPLLALSLLVGCGVPASPDPDPDPEEHECAGTWGVASDELDVIHADPSVGSGGDGSLASPVPSLGAALDLARSSGDRTILLAPGTYRAEEADRSFSLSDTWADDGLIIAGCGAAETLVEGIEAWPPGTDETTPGVQRQLQRVFDVYGDVQGVEIRDLAVVGGRRGVVVRLDAGSEQPIVLERLLVDGNLRTGVLVQGRHTAVDLVDVEVLDTVPGLDDTLGYGIAAQALASPWDTVTGRMLIQGGRVSGATRVGVMVDRAAVEIVGLEVLDTAPVDGELGRGLQIQNSASGLIEEVLVRGNSDTGIFLQMPLDVTVRDSTIELTARGTIPDLAGAEPSGDGLCATQSESGADPSSWLLILEGNTFGDNGRAGALVEDISVAAGEGNVFAGNGLVGDSETFPLAPDTDALFVQGAAVVTAGEAVELGGAGPWGELEMYRDVLALDDLAE